MLRQRSLSFAIIQVSQRLPRRFWRRIAERVHGYIQVMHWKDAINWMRWLPPDKLDWDLPKGLSKKWLVIVLLVECILDSLKLLNLILIHRTLQHLYNNCNTGFISFDPILDATAPGMQASINYQVYFPLRQDSGESGRNKRVYKMMTGTCHPPLCAIFRSCPILNFLFREKEPDLRARSHRGSITTQTRQVRPDQFLQPWKDAVATRDLRKKAKHECKLLICSFFTVIPR
jgi:hypothetical protein